MRRKDDGRELVRQLASLTWRGIFYREGAK
jgi:hypothetical protein